MEEKYNIFRGCLLGLAVGDAMGYTVDDRSLAEIREDYGPNGLLGYDLANGYADVTSYTQLAAFAADGLLMGLTRQRMQGDKSPLIRYVALALREWSRSQQYCQPEPNYCWLSAVPQLKRRNYMDSRMLDILGRGAFGTLEKRTMPSVHPGALTAVVPIAMLAPKLDMEQKELDLLGAETVALTHGEPRAFLSGAVLTHALSLLIRDGKRPAAEVLQDTVDAVQLQFGRDYSQTTRIWELLQMAQTLAEAHDIMPADAMERLGCKTAPEVLAGALYACITCGGDFDTAMITAVNHSGHSAAVGAIVGAVLGTVLGQEALPEFYLECLEPAKLLTVLADDLLQGCPMEEGSNLFDDDWDRKYLHPGI